MVLVDCGSIQSFLSTPKRGRMEPQNFEKLSITLPAEMAKAVREKVISGGYGSVSEIIREAMRGWLERERRLANLDAAIAKGLADVDAGRVQALEEVRRELTERFAGKAPRMSVKSPKK